MFSSQWRRVSASAIALQGVWVADIPVRCRSELSQLSESDVESASSVVVVSFYGPLRVVRRWQRGAETAAQHLHGALTLGVGGGWD